jgi:HAD superfamily hydrolase (TIGR01457 family)
MFQGFIFDLDGTVYRGEKLIAGAATAVEKIKQAGGKVVYLTNKPLAAARDYAAKLTSLGIPTPEERVITSSQVMVRYLQEKAPGSQIFVIGEKPLLRELEAGGFSFTENPAAVDYVIAAFDRTFDYHKLNTAYQAIKRGAHFVATNPDLTCPTEEGDIPDCGATIAALEAITGKKVEVVVGKPSPLTIAAALAVLGLPPRDCLLVGDRLETDILMGKEGNLATGLVLTGVTDEAALRASPIHPDFIFPSIADVPALLLA